MRLLFATSIKTWGGGEKWMLDAATGLAARDHAVTIAARPGSAIHERAIEAGVTVLPVPFRGDLDAVSFGRVWRWCRVHRPDALVLNMDRVLRTAGTAARAAGVRVVLPRRGSEFPLKDGLLYRWTYRRVATGVIVNSQATARSLVSRIDWRPAGRIRVLPNGIDPARFRSVRPRAEVREELGVAQDAPVLIVVGELTTRKNAMLLVEILPRLLEAHPGLVVLLVGEGVERGPLEQRAGELGITDRVRLLGFRRDIPDLLGAADLLVHPARIEGFGYAVVEAMAAGLPVVATDASSLPEIVDDGRTGRLFPLDDGAALERAIREYLDDPDRRARDGAAGCERATHEFSAERRLAELDALLAEEAGRAGAG